MSLTRCSHCLSWTHKRTTIIPPRVLLNIFLKDTKSSLDAESSSSVGSGCSRAGTCSLSSGCVNRSGIKVSTGSVVANIQSVVPSIALVLDDSATNEVRVSPHHLRVVADRGEIGAGPRFVF